jgi:hypothetical protein
MMRPLDDAPPAGYNKYLDTVQGQDTLVRDALSKGASLKGHIVLGTEHTRLFIRGRNGWGHYFIASSLISSRQ